MKERLNKIEASINSDYGIQALNRHDLLFLLVLARAFEKLKPACEALQADIISRAVDHGDGFKVVECNLGVWIQFCDALDLKGTVHDEAVTS